MNQNNLIDKIKKWEFVKGRLSTAKAEESELRREICEEIINGRAGKALTIEKTVKKDFDDFIAVAKSNTTWKINAEEWEKTFDDFSEAEKKCVVDKPAISKTNLNKVDDDSKVYDALFEVPATPTLEVKHKA